EVQCQNVGFLRETLNTTRTRLASGVATPTDVSQAEARLSRGLADRSSTETDLSIARDRFLRIVGAPPAARLTPVSAVDRLIPGS
ncbi:TolC family protein, partial [Acinetobacter baumannii]